MPRFRLAACLLVASAVAVAASACQQNAPPAVPPATPAGKTASEEEENAKFVKEMEAQADVIFQGTIKSVEMANTDRRGNTRIIYGPPGMIIAGFDAHYVVVIQVEKVRKGRAEDWLGEKAFAIHSPSRDLHMDADKASGQRCEFLVYGVQPQGEGPPNVGWMGVWRRLPAGGPVEEPHASKGTP